MTQPTHYPPRLLRAGLIALILGITLGIGLFFVVRQLRTPSAANAAATLGTPSHWQQLSNVGTVFDVLALSDGSNWAALTNGRIARLDGAQWVAMSGSISGSLLLELPGTAPSLLVVGQDKAAWQTDDHGAHWQPVTLPFDTQAGVWRIESGLDSGTLDSNAIWLGTGGNLLHYVDGQWQIFQSPANWTLIQSPTEWLGADGSVWVTARPTAQADAADVKPTLWRYGADGWRQAALGPRVDSPLVGELDKALWIVRDDGSLARLSLSAAPDQAANWRIFLPTERAGIDNAPQIDSGAADSDGSVWWIDITGGLFHYDGQSWQAYPAGSSTAPLPHAAPPLIRDQQGHVWVGGDAMGRYANGQWTVFDPVHADLFGNQQKLYQALGRPLARDGSLWFAVSAAGLVRYNSQGWTWFGPQNNALPMPPSATIHDSYVPLTSAPDGSLLAYYALESTIYRFTP